MNAYLGPSDFPILPVGAVSLKPSKAGANHMLGNVLECWRGYAAVVEESFTSRPTLRALAGFSSPEPKSIGQRWHLVHDQTGKNLGTPTHTVKGFYPLTPEGLAAMGKELGISAIQMATLK